MTISNRWKFAPLWNTGEGSGAAAGGDGAAGGEAKTPESVLFPKEGEGTGDGNATGAEGADKTKGEGTGDGNAEWKEYVADPNKSDDENARLKAEHDKTKPAEKKDDKTADADKVPEDGKYTLTMPEGVEVDQELLDALGPDLKELNLTNGQAQKLADKFAKVQQDRVAKRTKEWGERVQKWADDAKADKDIGGDKWDGTVTAARRAIDNLGTPALKEYLEVTGGGNHPEVIRIFAKVGSMIREDDPAGGGAGGSGKPADPAHVLFPNDAPKG